MIPVDSTISADLVALARDSGAELPTLDRMLRARVDAPPTLVQVVDVFVARVARITAGATALAATAVLLFALHVPALSVWFGNDSVWMVAALGALVLASVAIGGGLARRAIARWPGEPLVRRAAALDRLALALPIAGLGGLSTLIGVIASSLGPRWWVAVLEHDAAYDAVVASRLHQLTLAVIGVVLAGAAVGWAAARRLAWLAVLHRRATFALGVALAVITVIAWHRLGAEGLAWNETVVPTDPAARGVLAATFALAGVLVLAAIMVRRRDRERGVLAVAALDAIDAARTANLVARQTSRVVRGGVAWLAMLALAIWLHAPRHGALFAPMTWVRALLGWSRWEAPDRTTLALELGLIVVIAHLVGSRLATRRAPRPDLARALDAWAVGATIAGTGAIASAFGVTSPIVGESFGLFFTEHGERGAAVLTATLHAMTIGIVVSALVGIWVGRAVHRRHAGLLRTVASPQLGIAGGILAGAIWIAGTRVDLDIHRISVSSSIASPASTAAGLGAVWTIAILMVIAHRAVRPARSGGPRPG